MNGKKAKAARQAARASGPAVRAPKDVASAAASGRRREGRPRRTRDRSRISLPASSCPDVLDKKTTRRRAHDMAGDGRRRRERASRPARAVPSFSERDLLTGQTITSQSVYRHKTLLFFSEGVMCQACFQQIQGLQQVGAAARRSAASSSSRSPPTRRATSSRRSSQYGITTPVIADDNRSMSEAFNTLGKGMHADTPGHAFALIDKGKVLWYRDYWLAPDRSMYVEPAKLLKDIPS